MVNFATTFVFTLMATAVTADYHKGRRHVHHRRHGGGGGYGSYGGGYGQPEQPSEVYQGPTGGYGPPGDQPPVPTPPSGTGPAPSGPAPTGPYGNSTIVAPPAGPETSVTPGTSESVAVSTVTVMPVPESSTPVEASTPAPEAPAPAPSAPAPAPYPEAPAPAPSAPAPAPNPEAPAPAPNPEAPAPAPSAPAPAPEGPSGGQCGVATVTVTVQNTAAPVTVTLAPGQSPPSEGNTYPTPEAPKPEAPAPAPEAPAPAPAPEAPAPAPETPATPSPAPEQPSTGNSYKEKPVPENNPPTESKPAPESKPSSTYTPPSGGSKRGIAYNDGSLVGLFSKAGWVYNWEAQPKNLDSGIEFVPMLHDATPTFTNVFISDCEKALASGSKYILGPNEPDKRKYEGGAELSVGDTANLYKKYIQEPFGNRAQLVAPSFSSTGGAELPWLDSFKKACSDCKFDFYALHWYGFDQRNIPEHAGCSAAENGKLQAELFKQYVKDSLASPLLDKPTWWTEFSAEPKEDAQINAAFLEEVIPFLESQEKVFRYAPYYAANNYLVNGKALSVSGQVYNS